MFDHDLATTTTTTTTPTTPRSTAITMKESSPIIQAWKSSSKVQQARKIMNDWKHHEPPPPSFSWKIQADTGDERDLEEAYENVDDDDEDQYAADQSSLGSYYRDDEDDDGDGGLPLPQRFEKNDTKSFLLPVVAHLDDVSSEEDSHTGDPESPPTQKTWKERSILGTSSSTEAADKKPSAINTAECIKTADQGWVVDKLTASNDTSPDSSKQQSITSSFTSRGRSKKFTCFLIVLIVSILIGTLIGVGFAILAHKKESQNNTSSTIQEEEVKTNDTGSSAAPSASPSATTFLSGSLPTHAPPVVPDSTTPTSALTSSTTDSTTSPTGLPTSLPPSAGNGSGSGTTTDSSVTIELPPYPSFRFVPWQEVPVVNQRVASNFLDYTETTWNLPGTANNNYYNLDRFWEGQSFATIQVSAPTSAFISTIAQLGFQATTWDCWVNHYQNFTWDELLNVVVVQPNEDNILATATLNSTVTTAAGPSIIQGAMTTLGWSEQTWSTKDRFRFFFPPEGEGSDRSLWDQLAVDEQEAATKICYTPELWDRIPVTKW